MKTTVLGLILFCQLGWASEWQRLFQAYQQSNSPVIRDSIYQLIKTAPLKPEHRFLEGLIEINGERAIAIYRDVFTKYPKSEVADNALLKITEYLYVKGLYAKTSKYALDLIRLYPNSECIGEAGFFLLSSLLAMNKGDSADYYQRLLSAQFPGIVFTAGGPTEIAQPAVQTGKPQTAPLALGTEKGNEPRNQTSAASGKYFLQVGVFGVPQNAAALRTRLQKAGYDARVEAITVQGRQLSAVRLGNFQTRTEAQVMGDKLKREQGIEYLILKM